MFCFCVRIRTIVRQVPTFENLSIKNFTVGAYFSSLSPRRPAEVNVLKPTASGFGLSTESESRFQSFATVSHLKTDTMPEKKAFSRLSTNVVPENYDLTLKPNLKAFTFSGNEVIDVEVKIFFHVHACHLRNNTKYQVWILEVGHPGI